MNLFEKIKKKKGDPCWKGYAQLGTKDKDGKEVPNCVPVSEVSDETLKSYTKKAMVDTVSNKKDRNAGMKKAYTRLAGLNKPIMEEEQLDEISQETKDSYKAKATDQIKQAEPYAKNSEYSSLAKRIIARRTKGLKLAEAEGAAPEMDIAPSTYVKKQGVSAEGEHSGRKVRRGAKGKITFNIQEK